MSGSTSPTAPFKSLTCVPSEAMACACFFICASKAPTWVERALLLSSTDLAVCVGKLVTSAFDSPKLALICSSNFACAAMMASVRSEKLDSERFIASIPSMPAFNSTTRLPTASNIASAWLMRLCNVIDIAANTATDKNNTPPDTPRTILP